MDKLDQAILEFGKRLQFDKLSVPKDKPLVLNFDKKGTLFVERFQDKALIYLGRKYEVIYEDTYFKALAICSKSYREFFDIRAGLQNENILYFLATLTEHHLSNQNIELIFEKLSDCHDHILS